MYALVAVQARPAIWSLAAARRKDRCKGGVCHVPTLCHVFERAIEQAKLLVVQRLALREGDGERVAKR